MIAALKYSIEIKASSCDIEIKNGAINAILDCSQFFKSLGNKFVVIADSTSAELYGKQLFSSLLKIFSEGYLLSFPSGERSKTRETKAMLEDQMLEKGLGRDTCLFALGGGVSTDLGGYIAATYCRGIPLISLPTTLLAMVDASIGGKTGINVPQGKNMIGCIYHPKKILIDPTTLQSLPRKELRNGIVEMIKHGLIADKAHFKFLEDHVQELMALDSQILPKAILDSASVKIRIIQQDDKDQGIRNLLNFGHTVAHALEHLTHYALSHGEAVAIGLLVESYISMQLGHFIEDEFNRLYDLLKAYSLPLLLPQNISVNAIISAMQHDKKTFNNAPRVVLLDRIGSPMSCDGKYCATIDENLLIKSLEWMTHDLCRR